MDILSIIGVILAFVAIIGGNYLEGGHASALLNGPAALIVIGGTLGAAPKGRSASRAAPLGFVVFHLAVETRIKNPHGDLVLY